MFSNYEDLPRGAVRQKGSGAIVFPIHPRDKEAQKDRQKLKEELAEVHELKEELKEIIKNLPKSLD